MVDCFGLETYPEEMTVPAVCQPQESNLDFRSHYPQQNPDRCRMQFKLVKDMDAQFEEIAAVVCKYTK